MGRLQWNRPRQTRLSNPNHRRRFIRFRLAVANATVVMMGGRVKAGTEFHCLHDHVLKVIIGAVVDTGMEDIAAISADVATA